MSFLEMIEVLANISAILTALVAVFFFCTYKYEQRQKEKSLESYLKLEKEMGIKTATNDGRRTILHLVEKLGLTESEILQISFRSKCINRFVSPENSGRATDLLLQYKD